MIKLKIRYADNLAELSFPCTEQALQDTITAIRADPIVGPAELYVAEVIYPEELGFLQDRFANLDEVNYLAKRMDSFFGDEEYQFYEAMKLEGFYSLPDLINLSFNLIFTVGESYLADNEDEINDALEEYTANDENSMAAYYNGDDGIKKKLTSAVWSVELHGGRLFGRIECSLKEPLTAEETENLREWITGQCSDGLSEGFEQQPIDTEDGKLYVSFWNSGEDYAMMTEDEFEDYLQNADIQMGGM